MKNINNKNNIEDLAWLLFQLKLNERAKEAEIITESMYISARDSLRTETDRMEEICYGFTKNTQTA